MPDRRWQPRRRRAQPGPTAIPAHRPRWRGAAPRAPCRPYRAPAPPRRLRAAEGRGRAVARGSPSRARPLHPQSGQLPRTSGRPLGRERAQHGPCRPSTARASDPPGRDGDPGCRCPRSRCAPRRCHALGGAPPRLRCGSCAQTPPRRCRIGRRAAVACSGRDMPPGDDGPTARRRRTGREQHIARDDAGTAVDRARAVEHRRRRSSARRRDLWSRWPRPHDAPWFARNEVGRRVVEGVVGGGRDRASRGGGEEGCSKRGGDRRGARNQGHSGRWTCM